MKTYIILLLLPLLPLFGFSQENDLFLKYHIESLKDTEDSINKINPEDFGTVIKDSSVIVQISGLGEFNSNTLDSISKKINSFFGFKTIIVNKNFKINNSFFRQGGLLNVDSLLSSFHSDTITVYVTNHILYGGNFYVGGATNSDNLNIILDGRYWDIQQTAIHELGHMFGLSHCDNEFCIMSTNDHPDRIILFCNKCLETMYR